MYLLSGNCSKKSKLLFFSGLKLCLGLCKWMINDRSAFIITIGRFKLIFFLITRMQKKALFKFLELISRFSCFLFDFISDLTRERWKDMIEILTLNSCLQKPVSV